MAVRIGRGSKARWRSGDLSFRIESKSDHGQMVAVFERIESGLFDLGSEDDPGPKYVSDSVPLPDGLAFWVDSPDASDAIIEQIIEVVVNSMEDAGVEARVSALEEFPSGPAAPKICVIAVPSPSEIAGLPAEIPAAHIDRAVSWVLGCDPESVWVGTSTTALALPAETAASLLRDWLSKGRKVLLAADAEGDQRQSVICPPSRVSDTLPHVSISLSGNATQADLDRSFERIIDEGRELADGSCWVFASVERQAMTFDPDLEPIWAREPRASNAFYALHEGVLDAAPWQLLTDAVAAKLPEPLVPAARYDRDRRELRLAEIDDWLRDDQWGHPWGTIFRRTMRQALGGALLTQDQAWEILHAGQAPPPTTGQVASDGSVRIVGRESPHPTLGVTPLQLVSLLRNEPFADDSFSLPVSLRSWLRQLAERLPERELHRLRHVAMAVAENVITDDQHLRRTFADWFVRTATPGLLDVAGLGHGETLRRLEPLTERIHPLAPCKSVLVVVAALYRELDGRTPIRNDRDAPVLRTVRAIEMATSRASTHVEFANNMQADEMVLAAIPAFISSPGDVDDEMARRVWGAGAFEVATASFLEAEWSASLSRPRDASTWMKAFFPIEGGDARSLAAAASALLREPDAATAWDGAIAAAQGAAPEFWNTRIESIRVQLGEEALEAGWDAGRRRLQAIHLDAQVSAALSAAVVPAAMVFEMAAMLALAGGRDVAITEMLWRDFEILVDRLTAVG